MAFRPKQLSQFQPSTWSSSVDCVPACTAHLINRATVDGKKPSHADVRKASGVTDKRGLSYAEAATAAAKFGVTLTPRYGITRAQLKDILTSGRACAVSIDCSVTVNTPYRTNSFTGDHSEFAQAYSSSINAAAVEDPGTTAAGYLNWPFDLLCRAAEARTKDHLGVSHGINVLVGPDTEGVKWKCVMTGKVRATPDTNAAAIATLKVGTTYQGGRTQNGGPWERAYGTTGYGWVHVLVGTRWGWARGEAMKVIG